VDSQKETIRPGMRQFGRKEQRERKAYFPSFGKMGKSALKELGEEVAFQRMGHRSMVTGPLEK